MLPVKFCNYNLDYQQRLGFLKVLVTAARGVRGGKEELQRKIESLYKPAAAQRAPSNKSARAARLSQKSVASPRSKGSFDPEALLRVEEVPSWQSGFSFQRLDRLVLWAEMTGLITPSGRLSEWSRPLTEELPQSSKGTFESGANPFILDVRERAYFLAVLSFHDHVMLHLISSLSRFDVGTRIDSRRGCIEVIAAIGKTLDMAAGGSVEAVRVRHVLRDLLERLAGMESITHKGAFLNPEEREKLLAEVANSKTRNHLAEYHAVCRFEQLTDLGFLLKEDPSRPAKEPKERARARTTWAWYVTDSLKKVGALVSQTSDVETFLSERWAQTSLAHNHLCQTLHPVRDQKRIAGFLDRALPRATRQLGAIQVHTWVFIAALDAIEEGAALEFATAYFLLDAIHSDSRFSPYIRLSGQKSYLGRTASVIEGTMLDYISRYPIEDRT